jgi:multidrug resistance efflux pump
MKSKQVMIVLEKLSSRLATVADQAREACAQAQHTLQRVDRLQGEVGRWREEVEEVLAEADTAEHRLYRPRGVS